MASRRVLFRILAIAFALTFLLAAVSSEAKVFEDRALKSKTSISAKPKSTSHKSVSTKKAKHTSSSKAKTSSKKTKSPTISSAKASKTVKANAKVAPTTTAKAATTSSADSVFCKSFVKQCYKSALAGQTKEVSVVHSCQRNGSKHSTSYTYSCKRGKTSLTSKVLKALGDDYAAYTTVRSSTTTTVAVVPAATTIITTEIPVTVTSVVPSTVTQVSYTSTSTAVYFGTDKVPVYEVVVSDKGGSRRRRGTDGFCAAYSTACSKECTAASSKVKHSICKAKSSSKYTLACVCKNGKRQTQHALAALVEDRNTITVSTVATFTSLVTDSLATSLSTSVVTEGAITFTTTIPVTSTFTFLSTSTTASTLTGYTGQSVTEVALSTSGATTTTTTATAPTTTQLVLAATGYAHGISTDDGTDLGPLRGGASSFWATFASYDPASVAVELMAVRDAATGSYQLAELGDPTRVFISEFGGMGSQDFESGSNVFANTYFGPASLCGTAGSAAGPAAGSGWFSNFPCQTFVFSPLALDDSSGGTSDTLNLQPIWYNPAGSATSSNTGAWVFYNGYYIEQAADADAFAKAYGASNTKPFTLRFPFSS